MAQVAASAYLAKLATFFFQFAAGLGFEAAACGMLTGPKAQTADLFYFNNWPAAWLTLYRGLGLSVDPAVRWALTSGAATSWTDLARQLDPSDPGLEMIRAAARFGYSEGFVLPVRTPAGHLGLVCLGGSRGLLSADEYHLLQLVGTAVLNRAEALTTLGTSRQPAPALTKRERDCVTLLIKGRGERDIGVELGISAATARFHLDNARAKLGASSRAQLAVMAAGLVQDI